METTMPLEPIAYDLSTNRVLTTGLGEALSSTIQRAYIATLETTTGTSYADLATPGPAVTVEIGPSGIALVIVSCDSKNASANMPTYMGVACSGATTIAPTPAKSMISCSLNWQGASRIFVQTGLAVGSNTFTAKYSVDGGTGSFQRRSIEVIPL